MAGGSLDHDLPMAVGLSGHLGMVVRLHGGIGGTPGHRRLDLGGNAGPLHSLVARKVHHTPVSLDGRSVVVAAVLPSWETELPGVALGESHATNF